MKSGAKEVERESGGEGAAPRAVAPSGAEVGVGVGIEVALPNEKKKQASIDHSSHLHSARTVPSRRATNA